MGAAAMGKQAKNRQFYCIPCPCGSGRKYKNCFENNK
ncbi:MAG: SEC-C metal-binding domain-containing protein [Faecousia sp.]